VLSNCTRALDFLGHAHQRVPVTIPSAEVESDGCFLKNPNISPEMREIGTNYWRSTTSFGSGTTVAQGDINLAAPGDDLIDAAGSQTSGSASAQYDPSTGQIVVSVDGVNNWYIESASSSLTNDAHSGRLAASLVTDNDTRIGETTLALFSYSDQNLGNVAEAGLPLDDLRIYWNAGLGQPLEMQQVTYLGVAEIVSLPEPTTLSLLLSGLGSFTARQRKSFVR